MLGQFSIKFHVQLQGSGVVGSGAGGGGDKMAATSIYGINLKRSRSFSIVRLGRLP